jgi:hypothetical protein
VQKISLFLSSRKAKFEAPFGASRNLASAPDVQ